MCYAPARPGETLAWYLALSADNATGRVGKTDTVGLVPPRVLATVDSVSIQ